MFKIGFIGAGNMGGALITAACRTIGAEQVVITDYDKEKAQALAAQTGCAVAADNMKIAADAEFIVLAVKPGVIRPVATGIADNLPQILQKGIELLGHGDALEILEAEEEEADNKDDEKKFDEERAGLHYCPATFAYYEDADLIGKSPFKVKNSITSSSSYFQLIS